MVSDGRGRHGYALIALIVLVFLAGCVDYPPAWSVCLTCEEGIEGAATDGPNVSVSQSELFIQVREDGNGHWTVRSELTGPGVEALRSDSALVERFAGEAVTDEIGDLAVTYAIHDGDVHDVTGRMDGDVIVISFVVEEMARTGLDGVLLVDYFNTRGEPPARYGLGADRVVLHGPTGTVVTHKPTEATLSPDGNAVVWEDRRQGVSGDTYVTISPDASPTTRIATGLTVGSATAAWAVPEIFGLGFLYSIPMLAAAVLLVRHATGRTSAWISDPVGAFRKHGFVAPPVEYVAVPLALLALTAAVVADAGGPIWGLAIDLLISPPAVPATLFLLLGVSAGRNRRFTRTLVVAIGGSAFVMAATLVVSPPINPPYSNLESLGIGVATFTTLAVGPLLFFLVRLQWPVE